MNFWHHFVYTSILHDIPILTYLAKFAFFCISISSNTIITIKLNCAITTAHNILVNHIYIHIPKSSHQQNFYSVAMAVSLCFLELFNPFKTLKCFWYRTKYPTFYSFTHIVSISLFFFFCCSFLLSVFLYCLAGTEL